MNTTVSMMTEKKPTYTYDDPAANAAAIMAADMRRLTTAALNDAGAALVALQRLVAYIAELQAAIGLGTLDYMALEAARRQLRDLRACAETLGVGLE